MPQISFEPSGKKAVANDQESILELAKRLGLPLESICGGRGTCGRCKVQVVSGNAPVTEEDRRRIRAKDLSRGVRLACQLRVDGDMVIRMLEPESSKHTILEEAQARFELDPIVQRMTVRVPEATLESPTSIVSRLREGLLKGGVADARFPLTALTALSKAVKEGLTLQVFMRGDELLTLSDSPLRGPYGIALDVGSTTVVAYLLDLQDGSELSVRSKLNPQIQHGDDVISRITYSITDPGGREELQRLIIGCINGLIAECSRSAGLSKEEIVEVMFVGNTAMHHSVFGLDQRSLTLVPFAAVTAEAMAVKAHDVGIGIAPEGYVCALPNVAGFVGADHIGVLLASDLEDRERPTMAIDIGTNGEISVGDRKGIISASVAAGPAFEGGNLSCGMRGSEGAIDHVTITTDNILQYTTIGGALPRGLCGSGVIDLVAQMFLAGLIDGTGQLQPSMDPARFKRDDGGWRYILAEASESAHGQEVFIAQEDIVQVQFAKAALHAASEILMERRGVLVKDLDAILLAGAFGNYVDPLSARTIGMFPEVPIDRIMGIGNAAGAGSKQALLSLRRRRSAEELAKRIRYIELAAMPDFEERFFSSLYFPHSDPDKFPEAMSMRGASG